MKKKIEENDKIVKRLDGILYLLVEIAATLNQKYKKKSHFKSHIVKVLNSIGLTPTEIAHILGYKSRTSVASHLYSKRKQK
jgi:ADP-dependent phosphofructokinase/glucokinase